MGNVIPGNTLTPVVDMAGTPTTKKATISNIANAILSESGNLYVSAARANIANVAGTAGVVSNAAQPNITSVGTLANLTSTGTINFTGASNVALGPIGNVKITGGSNGQVLSTNGSGTLTWINQSGGNGSPGGSNTQIQFNDGGSFGGVSGLTFDKDTNDLTVSGNVITESIQSPDSANISITPGSPGPAFIFTIGGALTIPGGHLLQSNDVGEFELRSANGLVISTDIGNANLHFTFATDGQIYCPANANFEGTRVNVGPTAPAFELESPTLVIGSSSNVFVQSSLRNENANGSADWVAYGASGSDIGGWADMGFDGYDFNDPTYTLTAPGDGYLFVQGYANNAGGGSLILATGDQGSEKDIIFGTGGFLSSSEFGRISHANNAFELTRAGSTMKFDVTDYANLPLATTPGIRTFISDANLVAFGNFGATVSGGGANTVPVYSDGTNWCIG